MIKAAFFDIDGTLFSHQTKTVPDSAKYAIRELRRQGVRTFIASGRHITSIRATEPLKDVEFDGYVTVNGQYCFDREGVIYDNALDPADVRTMEAHAARRNLALGFMEAEKLYINLHDDCVRFVHGFIQLPLPEIGDLKAGCNNKVYQMIVYAGDEELDMLPKLESTVSTRWVAGGVDMIPATGSKAIGIAHVLKHYGIDPSEAIAFGDGDNDIEMLGAVGTSVVMGNASDAVKAHGTMVTDSVDEDGIYNALVKLGAIEPMAGA